MSKAPTSIIGIDLGNDTLKAVRIDKKGGQFVVVRMGMIPKTRLSNAQQLLTEQDVSSQLKELAGHVKASGADVHYTINSPNSTVRYAEIASMPQDDVRSALKLNSAAFLRQNFENYVFDVCPLDSETAASLKLKKGKPSAGKMKLLVGGVSFPETLLYFHASRRAGIKPKTLQLAPISLINCLEGAYPDVFHSQALALLDLGYLTSTLTILDKGKPILTRSVPVGGRQITEYIATMNNSDFAKAEAAKLEGDDHLGEAVTRTCVTLVREVRSSINFFEKNSDLPISKVLMGGASVRSPVIVEALAKDIGAPCEIINPTRGLVDGLPADQQQVFRQNLVAFSAAVGAARTYLMTATATVGPKPPTPVTPPPGATKP
jgi:type IV pilus assembly protein PilM